MLGYTFSYQLLVYSCDSWLLSSFMLLCSYPSVQLFIMLFSYLIFVVILVIILCTLFICMSSPLYTHTHQVAFWRPEFARPDIGHFVSIRCSLRPYASRRAGASPYSIPVFLSFLPHITSWFSLCRIQLLFQFFIYMMSYVDAYMWYCSNHDLLSFRFIACFGLLKA